MKFMWHGISLLLAIYVPMNLIHVVTVTAQKKPIKRAPRRQRSATAGAFASALARRPAARRQEVCNGERHRSANHPIDDKMKA